MNLKARVMAICVLILYLLFNVVALAQTTTPLTNDDVISLLRAGIGEDVVLLKIQSSPAKFKSDMADLVALKQAGASDALIAAMLKSKSIDESPSKAPTEKVPAVRNSKPAKPRDLKAAVILPFEVADSIKGATGLAEQTRIELVQLLKEEAMFSAVLSPEDIKDEDKNTLIEIGATLVDFSPGNVATRMVIGLGTGRAHAGWDVTVKSAATGQVVWKKRIKETASFWSNSASSSAQRLELPEKVAKGLVKELKGFKF